jgi:hypothetical protein
MSVDMFPDSFIEQQLLAADGDFLDHPSFHPNEQDGTGDYEDHSGESRHLTVGDRIQARPCVVTVEKVTTHNAYGHCSTCDDTHVIDRRRYEAGRGPWRPADIGRTEQ